MFLTIHRLAIPTPEHVARLKYNNEQEGTTHKLRFSLTHLPAFGESSRCSLLLPWSQTTASTASITSPVPCSFVDWVKWFNHTRDYGFITADEKKTTSSTERVSFLPSTATTSPPSLSLVEDVSFTVDDRRKGHGLPLSL